MKFFALVIHALLPLAASASHSNTGSPQRDHHVSQKMVDDFKKRTGVRSDFDLDMFLLGNKLILEDGTHVSLDNLTPVDLFSSRAKCFKEEQVTDCPTVAVDGQFTLMLADAAGSTRMPSV